jgi:pilus assembly protein CpaC
VRRIVLLLVLAFAAPALRPAAAQQAVAGSQAAFTLPVGEGRLFRLNRDATHVFVADSSVADAQIVSSRMVYVYGRRVGTTSVTAAATGDNSAGTLDIRVVRSAAAARDALPGAHAAGGNGPVSLDFVGDRLVVSGEVNGVGQALAAEATAGAFGPDRPPPLDRTQYYGGRQVTLRVRIAEVSRTAINNLGVDLAVAARRGSLGLSLLTGGFLQGQSNIFNGLNLGQNYGLAGVTVTGRNVNADALINALQEEQVLSMLAEPNLTTVSGRTARFLAGGQVPIPVPQSFGVTTIEYKPYGVSLAFTPTLLPGDRIALDVHPEVSEIDSGNAVTIDSTSVPAFTTRSTETTVEMASGQTVAISGLLMRSITTQIQRYPFLSDIPILGALFRSQAYQRGDTELVVLITPVITEPVASGTPLPLPTDNVSELRRAGTPAGFAVN